MNSHKNARLGFAGRVDLVTRIVRDGHPVAHVARALGVSERTAWKWLGRFRREGWAGLADRSSRPHSSPRRLAPRWRRRIAQLRRRRWSSPRIAQALGLPVSTVVVTLRRLGLARLPALQPPAPQVRYERARPGELLHVDTKKLGRITGIGHRIHHDRRRRGRGAGWEYLYVAIDDYSRVGYGEIHAREDAPTGAAFLTRALAWYAAHGVQVQRVMSDNGGVWISHATTAVYGAHGVRHLRTRPYRPQTNGKAERFIQTLLREWAYGTPYRTSQARTAALPTYLAYYNAVRRHTALGAQPPLSRLAA